MTNTEQLLQLRGLLAAPSGNDDDPWQRVVLHRTDATPEIKFSRDDDFRARLAGATPQTFSLESAGTYEIQRPTATPATPLAGKIAIVTGAAGAIGAGICRGLLEKGCRVAATDVSPDNLQKLVADLQGVGEILGVPLDVTDPQSVAAGFAQVIAAWGGLDIVVVNAGIAIGAALLDTSLDAFRKLEKVNVDGALLTLTESGRVFKQQNTGGDIIVISTKNFFSPGAGFGAYCATKSACHQLARIASLEFAPFGVRVNMVAPDAVFSEGGIRSGLWAEVGPARMKSRGLDEKGLEEYYRNRNLLKARVTATHVANAVLFFATRQTPTTGATIPVDGGLPDASPR
jgi:NAD(P)-dependent dehydrogenase (short-subunit alcohol dehydrogenase family)